MVKAENLKKSELVEFLHSSAISTKQRNRAVKLLKKFEPNPKRDLDHEGDPNLMKAKQYDNLQAYLCYRCDKVKQTHIRVLWRTTKGVKVICNTCYTNLCQQRDLETARKSNNSGMTGSGAVKRIAKG